MRPIVETSSPEEKNASTNETDICKTDEAGKSVDEVPDVFGNLSAEDHVAVYVRLKDEYPSEIRFDNSNRSKNNEVEPKENDKQSDTSNNFEILSDQWLNFSLGFFETVPFLNSMAKFLHVEKAKAEPVAYLEKISTRQTSKLHEDGISQEFYYIIHKQHSFILNKKIDLVNRYQRMAKTYSNSFVLSLVAQYEAMFSDVLTETLNLHPKTYISAESKISAADVISSKDLEAIKTKIISNKVDELLHEKHSSQVESLFKKLKIDMPPSDLMRDFSEICERRNLITHANSVVNTRYIENLKAAGFDESKLPKIGSTISTESAYSLTANARIALLGFWVIHSVWRKLYPNETKTSASALINSVHDLLVGGFTKMARRLCEFALDNFNDINEEQKAYIIVNLALTHQLEDEKTEDERRTGVEVALKKRDWSIVNAELSLALCCLKEDNALLPKRIDEAIREGLTQREFLTWALFTKLREMPLYAEKMREHFEIIVENDNMNDKNDV